MKREELISVDSKDKKVVYDKLIKSDVKFLNRTIRNLEDSIEDSESSLEDRLSSITPIDSSVVESLYGNITDQKAKLKMYQDFKSEYYGA